MSVPKTSGGLTDGFVRWLDRVGEDGPRRVFWRWFTTLFGRKLVERKLIDGEEVLSLAMHSWVAYIKPVAILLGGAILGLLWLWWSPINTLWLPMVVTFVIMGYGFYKLLWVARDRFVITDSRVFRVWGVFSLSEAEMEIVRVLDITVEQPWYLRMVGAGNLVLENAGQQQGLRRIERIPQSSERAAAIHRRRRKMLGLLGDEDSATLPEPEEPQPVPPAQHPRKPRPVTARRPH